MTDRTYFTEWRKFAGITQDELGSEIGMTGEQVTRIEKGERDFDGRFLRAFKEAINAALEIQGQGFAKGMVGGSIRMDWYDPLRGEPDPATLGQPLDEDK